LLIEKIPRIRYMSRINPALTMSGVAKVVSHKLPMMAMTE
jgi:hypothetical protein